MRNTSLLAAPTEPVIENDLPLDLSCNSRRRNDDEEDECPQSRVMDVGSGLVASIGGPPSPPRSPADFRALTDLGYVAYHRQLIAMERQRQWLLERQHQQREQQEGVGGGDNEEEEEDRDERLRRIHHRLHRHHHERRQHHHRQQQQQQRHEEEDGGDDDDLLIMRRRRPARSPSGSGREESADEDDSDDSHQPMDLGANPKAYKKSLMKRYRKSPIIIRTGCFCLFFLSLPPSLLFCFIILKNFFKRRRK